MLHPQLSRKIDYPVTLVPTDARTLPDFTNPPVIEVALSAVFQPLQGYTSAHAGLFWTEVSKDFPRVEEQLPIAIPDEIESPQLVESGVRLQAMKDFPGPRLWLISEDGTELIQLQNDTFSCNWRQEVPGAPYPRYGHVKSQFQNRFRSFIGFAERLGLGTVVPARCEVSYVNHIPAGQGWERFGELHKILSGYADKHTFLPEPEEVRYGAKFVMRDLTSGAFMGRLTVSAQPGVRRVDKKPLIALTLTSRGRPIGAGISGVLNFLDLGHEWIVQGFADLTTDEMHRIWGRNR